MAGIPLATASMVDLLPDSIRYDERIAAAAKAVDAALAVGDANRHKALIWSRIDELEEPLLSNLAHQMHLEGYEGWQLAETMEQKRNLLRAAYILHFHKGTRGSLNRIFGILDMAGRITEWWESGEPAEDFPPYTFDIDIEVTRAIDDAFYQDVWGLVDALKNERSHTRKTRIIATARAQVPVIGMALLSSSTVTIYPYVAKDITIRSAGPYVGIAMQSAMTVTIYPAGAVGDPFELDDDGNVVFVQRPGYAANDLWEVKADSVTLKPTVRRGSTDDLFTVNVDDRVILKTIFYGEPFELDAHGNVVGVANPTNTESAIWEVEDDAFVVKDSAVPGDVDSLFMVDADNCIVLREE